MVVCSAGIALLSACSDNNDVGADLLEPVEEGTPKDSVMALIGKGPLTGIYADTARLQKGFRTNSYIIDGQTYEVLFYRELQGNVAEPVQQAKETPIVFKDGKVLGWGWRYYVDAMESLKLPSPVAPAEEKPAGPNIVPMPSADSAAADTGKKA